MSKTYKNVISLLLAFVMFFNTVVVSADLGSCISGMEEKCESNKQKIEDKKKECESIPKDDEKSRESREKCEADLKQLQEATEKECSEDNYYTEHGIVRLCNRRKLWRILNSRINRKNLWWR